MPDNSVDWTPGTAANTDWDSLESGGWRLNSTEVTLGSTTALLGGDLDNTPIDINSTNWTET